MRHKLLIIGLILLFSIVFIQEVYAVQCSDITKQMNIPCEVITAYLNCSGDAYTYNVNNESINTSTTMALVNLSCTESCLYNFTFTYTDIATYQIDLCDNITYASLSVVDNSVTITSSTPTSWTAKGFDFPTMSFPSDFGEKASREQIKILFKALINWGKELLFLYWWIIIIFGLFIFLGIKGIRKRRKNVHQQQ